MKTFLKQLEPLSQEVGLHYLRNVLGVEIDAVMDARNVFPMQVERREAKSTLKPWRINRQPPDFREALRAYYGENSTPDVTHKARHLERNRLSHHTNGLQVQTLLLAEKETAAMRQIGEFFFKDIQCGE